MQHKFRQWAIKSQQQPKLPLNICGDYFFICFRSQFLPSMNRATMKEAT